ncbi:MAG: DEAD/DEAH box helicase [Undibacterium sp.]
MFSLKIAHNATTAKLIGASKEVELIVSDLLSYMATGADKTFAFNSGSWDGKSGFYEFGNQTFPAGFVHMIHSELTRRGHNASIIKKSHFEPLGPEFPTVDSFGNDNPNYDFQMRSLKQVEKYGRGIIQVATGGGKSKIAKLIMARYRRMTLFLTTRGVLLYQMKRQLDDIGMNTGIIGDGEMKITKGINLGMVQTLVQAVETPDLGYEVRALIRSNKLKKDISKRISDEEILKLAKSKVESKTKRRDRILKVLEMIEVVIGEEAHEVGGTSYYEILKHCKNASVRVALTATPFMRDNVEDNMRLMAAFGPVIIKVSEDLLIKRGILAKPIFKFVNCQPHPKLRSSSPWERAILLGHTENNFMHQDIVRDALLARDHSLPFMTLVSRKIHGQNLVEAMQAAGLKVVFVQGSDDMQERDRAIFNLESGDIDGIVGTNIFDVGVDMPSVGLVQLAGGGKAEVGMRQRVGRALRRKKNVANFAFVADYSCKMNLTLREHTKQRKAIIENIVGFSEGILPQGQDFDWSIFERKYGNATC